MRILTFTTGQLISHFAPTRYIAGESQLFPFVFYSCLGFLGCLPFWRWPLHLTCPHNHISYVPLSTKVLIWGWLRTLLTLTMTTLPYLLYVLCLFVCLSSCFGVDSGDGQTTWSAVQRRHRLLRHSEGEFEIFSAEYLASSIRLKTSKKLLKKLAASKTEQQDYLLA